MSAHRFFVPPETLASSEITLGRDLAHRVGRVLRLQVGDRISLLNGLGREVEAEILSISRDAVRARALAVTCPKTEPRLHLVLYQALLPSDRFEWVLEKGTEIGVARFVPLVTTRCTARPPAGDLARRRGRWQAVVRAAAEQSHRALLPEVTAPATLQEALGDLSGSGLLAWEESRRPLKSALPELATGDALALFVGPEGGFTFEEAEAAHAAGLTVVSLGPRILRAETAGPILAALALYAAGEL